jgi:superfamily I DNA/RNA helicase
MIAAITPNNENSLFFAGDLGQRIFQDPFSWKALGIDIRGRSSTLKVNYRTSHQIRQAADHLLPKIVRDVDGIEQDRSGTVSIFNGPDPEICAYGSVQEEISGIASWLKQIISEGVEPNEIGIFVRTQNELSRARDVIKSSGNAALELSDRVEDSSGRVSMGTMHMAKGLEFKAVAVMACDDEILPLQERIELVADETELDQVLETERHLFYVACTRARDKLRVSGVTPTTVFFEDLKVIIPA